MVDGRESAKKKKKKKGSQFMLLITSRERMTKDTALDAVDEIPNKF